MVAVSTSRRLSAGTLRCKECNSRSQSTGNESSSSGCLGGSGVLRSGTAGTKEKDEKLERIY